MNKDNCMTLWNSAGDICTVLEFAITPQQFAQLLPTVIDNPDSNGKILEICELTSVITGKLIKLRSMNSIPKLKADVNRQTSKGNTSQNKVSKHSSLNEERHTPPKTLLKGPCTQEIDCQARKHKEKQCISEHKAIQQKKGSKADTTTKIKKYLNTYKYCGNKDFRDDSAMEVGTSNIHKIIEIPPPISEHNKQSNIRTKNQTGKTKSKKKYKCALTKH